MKSVTHYVCSTGEMQQHSEVILYQKIRTAEDSNFICLSLNAKSLDKFFNSFSAQNVTLL